MRRRLHSLDQGRVLARQIDGDGGAAADRAGGDDGAPRLMRKAVDLRQSQAGAFPERLGREERLEDSGQNVRRDADAGIGHRQRHEVALKPVHPVAFLQGDVARRQRDAAAAGHGVSGVNGDIDQSELELRDVDLDRPDICGNVAFELDVAA